MALLVALLLAPLRITASEFETRHAQDQSTSNPADLHFHIGVAGEPRRFHIGERIPLALSFSSDTPKKYQLNGATYDRSGRMHTEEFIAERDSGFHDPYRDYFGLGLLGYIGGGLRNDPLLDVAPDTIDVALNDWLAFDRPGRYRFYVKSYRLSRRRAVGEAGDRVIHFAAISNVFEIEVLPKDPAWETDKLTELRAVLTRQGAANSLVPDLRSIEARRELRFLGTPEAVQFELNLARHGDPTAPNTLLLVGARDRPATVAAFDAYLADPQVAIREWDIRLRALFTYVRKYAPAYEFYHPGAPAVALTPEAEARTVAAAKAKLHDYEAVLQQEAIRLIPAVAAKETDAMRIASTKAIAVFAPEAVRSAHLSLGDDEQLTREELIAKFPKLSEERQSALLNEQWDRVRGPEMVPVLQDFLAQAGPPSAPLSLFTAHLWGGNTVPEAALRRLLELSPAAGTQVVRQDLASAQPKFARFAAREFPSQEVPQADAAFRRALQAHDQSVLPLVAKFGTAHLADLMSEGYHAPQMLPCDEEREYLTYFVRISPGKDGEGSRMLARALAARTNRGCFRIMLQQVASEVWSPAIESQAVAALNDPEPELVISAAQVLSAHGSPAVEESLWKRAEEWSAYWRRRPEEERLCQPLMDPGCPPLGSRGSIVGLRLFEAISSARSWNLDEPRRKRLLALCLDADCRMGWDRPEPSVTPIQVILGNGLYSSGYQVGNYRGDTVEAMKDKLQLYPRGSQFRWCGVREPLSPEPTPTPLFSDLSEWLSQKEMNLLPYDREKCASGN